MSSERGDPVCQVTMRASLHKSKKSDGEHITMMNRAETFLSEPHSSQEKADIFVALACRPIWACFEIRDLKIESRSKKGHTGDFIHSMHV